MYAVQQPLHASALDDVMGAPAWKTLPTWYLVAENDEAIPPDAERLFAKRMGATTVEVASGHVAMVSHPDEVAAPDRDRGGCGVGHDLGSKSAVGSQSAGCRQPRERSRARRRRRLQGLGGAGPMGEAPMSARRSSRVRRPGKGDGLGRVLRRGALLAALAALLVPASALAGGKPSHPPGTYKQINLVSDIAGVADITDPNLVNPWGLAAGPTTPLWVADNGTDLATLYPGGTERTPISIAPLVVCDPRRRAHRPGVQPDLRTSS